MHARTTRSARRAIASGLAMAALLASSGCSTGSDSNVDSNGSDSEGSEDTSVSGDPLPAAASPEPSRAPAGTVLAFAPVDSTTFDADSRTLVALIDDRSSLSLVSGGDTSSPRVIDLGESAAGVLPGRDGTVLLPMDGKMARVDLRTGARTDVSIDANTVSAVDLPGGDTAVGDDSGVIRLLNPDGTETGTISGANVTSADALSSTETGVAVLDRRQTSLTDVDTDDGTLGVGLRAGRGAANLTTDRFGRVLVTDSTGTELLVFTTNDLLLRQRFPVEAQPWAIAYDDQSDTVWLTLPARNEVVGYTLDTGIPVEVNRFPTVRQPNSVSVDSESGDIFVGSATGDGLQRITVTR